tara:strand:+ start:3561 stop:4082 length:522 start_codon:yes stop_codon:yes gene_type:complete
MGFVKDYNKGRQGEQKVSEILSEIGSVSHAPNKKFYDWDLSVTPDDSDCYDKDFTVEVKFDEMEGSTGNIAIETRNSKSDSDSGVTATKADLWCHVLVDSVWITSVKRLKEFISETEPLRRVKRAGDGNAEILLFKTDDILHIFNRIDGFDKNKKDFLRNEVYTLLNEEPAPE